MYELESNIRSLFSVRLSHPKVTTFCLLPFWPSSTSSVYRMVCYWCCFFFLASVVVLRKATGKNQFITSRIAQDSQYQIRFAYQRKKFRCSTASSIQNFVTNRWVAPKAWKIFWISKSRRGYTYETIASDIDWRPFSSSLSNQVWGPFFLIVVALVALLLIERIGPNKPACSLYLVRYWSLTADLQSKVDK